jgi:ketosteroid isomerase-like protein
MNGDSMSIESVQNQSEGKINLVKQVYAAFSRRDIPAILGMLHADVEWGEPMNPYNPAGGTRHGHAGFLEWARIGRDAEDILALEPRKFLVDADSVAVVGYTRILAKPTGKTYETDFVHLFTFSGGKVIRFQEFFDSYIAGEAFRSA